MGLYSCGSGLGAGLLALLSLLRPAVGAAQEPRAAVLVEGGERARPTVSAAVRGVVAARGFSVAPDSEVVAARAFLGGDAALDDARLGALRESLRLDLVLSVEMRGTSSRRMVRIRAGTPQRVAIRFVSGDDEGIVELASHATVEALDEVRTPSTTPAVAPDPRLGPDPVDRAPVEPAPLGPAPVEPAPLGPAPAGPAPSVRAGATGAGQAPGAMPSVGPSAALNPVDVPVDDPNASAVELRNEGGSELCRVTLLVGSRVVLENALADGDPVPAHSTRVLQLPNGSHRLHAYTCAGLRVMDLAVDVGTPGAAWVRTEYASWDNYPFLFYANVNVGALARWIPDVDLNVGGVTLPTVSMVFQYALDPSGLSVAAYLSLGHLLYVSTPQPTPDFTMTAAAGVAMGWGWFLGAGVLYLEPQSAFTIVARNAIVRIGGHVMVSGEYQVGFTDMGGLFALHYGLSLGMGGGF